MRFDPVEEYLWIWGAALVVLGAGSLLIHPDFAIGDGVTEEHLFGVFETNGWHGAAGLSTGLLALGSVWRRFRMVEATLVVALAGGLLPGLAFLAFGDDSAAFGLIPVDLADAVTLHVIPGVVGLAAVAADRARRSAAT